jgi:hypothetical protein
VLLAVDDPAASLTVRPWPDDVLDRVGVDPRSAYVERFWLPLLGPSSILLLRRLAAELESSPSEVQLSVEATALSLGLGMRAGRSSPFARTVRRLCQFNLAHFDEHERLLLARRKLPPLNRPQVNRLPEHLQRSHLDWQHDPTRWALRANAQVEPL